MLATEGSIVQSAASAVCDLGAFKIKLDTSLGDLGTMVLGVVAVVALIVAWRQLSAMFLQHRANTLLALDERWENEPMLSRKAELYELIAALAQNSRPPWLELTEAQRRDRYAEALENMRKGDDVSRRNYQKLFQICGFLETIGHVAKSGYVPIGDMFDLLGGSILLVGSVFEPHIKRLQREPGGDERQYANFLWLYNRIQQLEEGSYY